ncbi:LOW QUALITY PROTEIN: protein HIDE1 [Leptosomus discolor]
MAAPRLSPLPPPLGLLAHGDEGPPKITCFAPRSFAGSTFELFAAGAGVPAQSVPAEPGQHIVDFPLDGATLASQCYRCRYRSYNGSAWQTSAFSVEIAVNDVGDASCHPPTTTPTGRPLPTSTTLRQDRSWLLPVAVSAAVLVLLLLAAAAVAAWRVEARRQRAKRQEASCWTETRCPTTEFSYDNTACAVGLHLQVLGVSPGGAASTGSPAPPFAGEREEPPARP